MTAMKYFSLICVINKNIFHSGKKIKIFFRKYEKSNIRSW
jgi:hypothetical protein